MKTAKTALLNTIPIMAGYIVLGSGFGILMKVNGYGLFWALMMSIFVYAGSMQYLGVSLIAGAVSLPSIALTTLLVNARHMFYGISMIDEYKGTGIRKPYLIHSLTDETYSLLCTTKLDDECERKNYYFYVSLFDQCYWLIGTVIGSLLATVLQLDFKGIEFSMTALFVTIFVEQWLTVKEHRPQIIGVASSVVSLFIFGKSNFLIPSMIAITTLLLIRRSKLEGGEHNG